MHCCTTATEAAHLDRRKLLEKRICQGVALTETFARHPGEMPPLVCTTLCVSSPEKIGHCHLPAQGSHRKQFKTRLRPSDNWVFVSRFGPPLPFPSVCSALSWHPSLSVRCSSRAHFFDALLRSGCFVGNKQQCGPCDSFLGCTANFLANFNPPARYPSFVFTSHTSTCPSSFMACVDSPLCHVGRTPSPNLCLQFSQTCLRFVSPPILQTVLSLLTLLYFLFFLTTPLSASMALIPSTLLFLCSILSSLSCF